MRISDLSLASGTPTATIKYYQREGLLPSSDKSAPNQATYGPAHLARLQLLRALTGVGGLSIARVRGVIASIDSDEPLLYTFAATQHAIASPDAAGEVDVSPDALATVDALMPGWRVSPENPGRLAAARVVDSFDAVGFTDVSGWLGRFAAAALTAAEADLDVIDAREGRDAKAQTIVVGTVLGDALFSALRLAAQEHVSSGRYPTPPQQPAAPDLGAEALASTPPHVPAPGATAAATSTDPNGLA